MAQRVYVLCRSNHDPITVGSLACETLLGRKYTHETDYIRWAGNFENTQNPTKCHVLVDCSVDDRDPGTKIPLICCKASLSGNQILIAERTSIPIPRVLAYSCNETADPLSTFIIMEYVGGEKLSAERLKHATETQKKNLYTSLANVLIQLRRLEFPAIGRLARCTKGEFEVSNQALTVDTNGLQLEGLN
ncbi:phosphotransferase enzyme family protein [Ilyonectria robusta]